MPKSEKQAIVPPVDLLAATPAAPLVFISHDSRDAEIAEAFSKLLKSVSAGMIRTFRSSDKKGKDGIDFGDEWYKRLMDKLQSTSDVVCLFSERSLDRPWILFEAGVAKGKLSTPVIGLAVGVPLSRISTGPFYQFQNMDDSEEELTKLVHQLAKRVPNCELDNDVVKVQVGAFKSAEAAILAKLEVDGGKSKPQDESEGTALAKVVEEMKALPNRIADRLSDTDEPFRRRRIRRFHPMMFEEMMHVSGESGDPVAILMAASLVRDDAPWLYELAMEVYKAVKTGDPETIDRGIARLRNFSELAMRGPLTEVFGFGGKESHMFLMEFPRMLEHMLRRTLRERKIPEPEEKVRPRVPGASSLRAGGRKSTS
jgi:hypothetical protein